MTVAGARERGQRERKAGGVLTLRKDTTARQLKTSLPKARDPARDGAAIFVVGLSELPVQRGFLVDNHKEMSEENAESTVLREVGRVKQRGLPEDYQQNADVHRIAHVAVQAADDKIFCGSDGRRRAQAANRELPGAGKINDGAYNQSEDAKPGQWPDCGRRVTTEQRVGDDSRHGAGNNDGE
jgi:hypothetical protein